VSVLAEWEDLAVREDRVGIHPGDPILLSPDFRIDEVLSWYLCRSSFARLAPETKRNYTDDYCLFFDFLWGRGRWWSEASADDLWDFEDWRTRSPRNPWKIGGARWNRGLAALARLYEWAVQREYMLVNPVLMRSFVGRNGEPVLVPRARAKNARTSEVRWLTPRFPPLGGCGLVGCDADELAAAGWAGRLADRNAAFANLLFDAATHTFHNTPTVPAASIRQNGLRGRIEAFATWASGLARRLGRGHESVPDDRHGVIGLARFRRALAWHIARRPGGLVALAIQYGHMRTAMSAGYAARGRDGIHELLDIEAARTTAGTLTTLHDDLTRGVGISEPAARRAIHAATQAPTFAGSVRTHRQARDILGNPALTVYDNPSSFLMCVYNRERALCHRLDVIDAPRLDRSAVMRERRTHRPARRPALQHAQVLEKQATSEALPGPLAERLARRAEQLRELADRHEHDRIHTQEATS
jgi:hypothetical protein